MLDIIKRVLTACGPLNGEDQTRLARITRLFEFKSDDAAADVIALSAMKPEIQSKAS
jgi:hypothetical protein